MLGQVAASLNEGGGAAALANDQNCLKSEIINVLGSKWSPRYFVLLRLPAEDGPVLLKLFRFASDVSTEPEHVATIDPANSAVEFSDGQPSMSDFGLDLFGVDDAAVSGLGFGGKLRAATSEQEEGVYKLSFETSSARQEWMTAFKRAGVQGVDVCAPLFSVEYLQPPRFNTPLRTQNISTGHIFGSITKSVLQGGAVHTRRSPSGLFTLLKFILAIRYPGRLRWHDGTPPPAWPPRISWLVAQTSPARAEGRVHRSWEARR